MTAAELDLAIDAANRLARNLAVARHAPERAPLHLELAHVNLEAAAISMRRIVEPKEEMA